MAADKLFDNMPELVLGAILGAALLVVALPYMRRVWRGLTEVIKSRLHPPVVRVAESAMFVVLTPTVVSTHPFGRASSSIRIVVAVNDQSSKRLDGVPVTFQTDNGTLSANDAIPFRGRSIVTYTDTDTHEDVEFLTYNPGQTEAGTAEAILDCSAAASGRPGVANVTVTVQRPGAHIVLTAQVSVRGPTAVTGLDLSFVPPTSVAKGGVVLLIAKVVDALGAPVVDGTPVFFAVNGGSLSGQLDAQGGRPSVNGEAHMIWMTDRENAGVFTAVASTGGVDNLGRAAGEAQIIKTYETT